MNKNGNVYTKECLEKAVQDQPKNVKLDRWNEVTKEEIYNAMLMPGEYKEENGKFYVKLGMLDGLICDEVNQAEVKLTMGDDTIDLFPADPDFDIEAPEIDWVVNGKADIEATRQQKDGYGLTDYNEFKEAREKMKKAFQLDEQLKWGYICNIAMHLYDEVCKDGLKLDYNRRNEIAKKMLKIIFF